MTDVVANPIKVSTRGKIYVASIIVSGLGLVATAVLMVLGLVEWLAVATAVVSAFGLVAGALGRSNLTSATVGGAAPDAPIA